MKISHFISLVLVLLLCSNSNIKAQDYTEEVLGFDPGEIQIVESPYPEDFRPLALPLFRGLLRLGTPNSYGISLNPKPPEVYRSQRERGALLNLKKTSIQRYFELVEIEKRSSDIKIEDLAAEFVPTIKARTPADDPVRKMVYWSANLKRIAPVYLKMNTIAKYWCKDGANCLVEGRAPGQYAYAGNNRGRPTWGGGADEFARLRAWQEYVRTEVPKIKTWAGQIEANEAYIVGKVYVPEYDFNNNGFVMRINAIEPKATQSALLTYTKKSDPDSFFARTIVNGNTLGGRLIDMGPEEAEKLIETLETQNAGKRDIYYVYKVSVRFEEPDITSGLSSTGAHQWIQEPVSNTVEFFMDETLKHKLFERDFSK